MLRLGSLLEAPAAGGPYPFPQAAFGTAPVDHTYPQ
jgi:hypothetical protein